MAGLTTPAEVCRHCGTPWATTSETCGRCGARIGARGPQALRPGDSGLALDRTRGRGRRLDPEAAPGSEEPTTELATERPRAGVGAPALVRLARMGCALVAVLLLSQALLPAMLPGLAGTLLASTRGASPESDVWARALLPWAAMALTLGVAQRALERRLVRSVVLSAAAAVLPGILLWGWEATHDHLRSALVRRGARRRAELLLRWSRGALVALAADVSLVLLVGAEFVTLPPLVPAVVTALACALRVGHLAALAIALPGVLERPVSSASALPTQLVCPECGDAAPRLQRFREGLAGAACPTCTGALLGPGQVTTLLALAQVEDAAYRREVRLGTGQRSPRCPQCATRMREVRLHQLAAQGCPACGSLWLARGVLPRLTGGRAFVGAAPRRSEPGTVSAWPAAAMLAAAVVLTAPWVAARAGLCEPAHGACASVPSAFGLR